MFDIAISTVNRVEKKQYLPETLKSMVLNTKELRKVNFVVGNPDITHLCYLEKNKYANIIPITDEEWALASDKGKCVKFNLNFYRCLTQQIDLNVQGRLYLEDDINFKKDWDIELAEHITNIKTTHTEFALSLYSAYDLSTRPTDIIQFERGFYGTQGVFFTSGIMQDFANYIMDNGIIVYRHMADILLQEYCNERNIPLFAIKNSLIQHTGEESSIHDNHFHKSISFKSE